MQLDLFELLERPQNGEVNMPFHFEPKRITSLKREVQRRIIDPEAIVKRMIEKIGCLYLHTLKRIKPYGNFSDSYEYLKKRVYTTFFSDLVDRYDKSENDIILKEISELLSDQLVQVDISKLTGTYGKMVEGKGMQIQMRSVQEEKNVFLITGTKQTAAKRHFCQRYFRRTGPESTRTICSISVLAELLLEKEMRYFYNQPGNAEIAMELLHQQFIKDGSVHVPESIMIQEKDIYNQMLDFAQDNALTIRSQKSNANNSLETAILAYYKKMLITGLDVMYQKPLYEEINGVVRNSNHGLLMRGFISRIIPKIHETLYHVSEVVGSSKDYAASYEIKKNIPEKTLKMMKSSTLLSFFEDVEYDELVDLSLADSFEREIMSYINTFKIPVPKGASFKVRRLGKYRAGGIFFPLFNTLAVDVSHPSAFIHEFWHMIDYYHQDNHTEFDGCRLSSSREFSKIVIKYKEIIGRAINSLDVDHPVRERFNGKTKYNKDYYFDSGEIFARCAEIYFREMLQGKSSLVKAEDSLYLPNDADLFEVIEPYFKNLLAKGEHHDINAA